MLEQRRVAAQFDEYSDFGAQDFRDDRLEQEIDRAQIVAAEQMLIVLVPGEEQDRRVA